MKLSRQQKKIIDYLEDGEFHCMANPSFFIKDDRTRISELRRKGYEFDSRACDKRCGVQHAARLVMRRIVAVPPPSPFEVFHEIMQRA